MKRKLHILSGLAALFLAWSVPAQDASNSRMVETQASRQRMIQGQPDQLKDTVKATDIIGLPVKNYQDEKLGKIATLAMDVESGRVVQVIISSGGFLGMGETLTPVPPGALHHDIGQKILQLDASQEKFNAAPKWNTAKWEENTHSNRVTEIYGYYGEQPYFIDNASVAWKTNRDGTFPRTLPRNMDGTINTDGGRAMDKAHNVEVARNVEMTNNIYSTHNPDGTWTRNYYPANSSWSKLGYIQKTSRLIGMSVNDLQDQKVGQVQNLIVDLSCGRIVAVIVSSGGYMGMDRELSAVPPAALRYNAGHDALQLDTSREALNNSPHFRANEWPDFNQPGYVGGVYHAYKVEPYFNPDATAQPDNTARNVRDRDSRTLTPLDQGNSQADIDITAQIRKEIIATEGMSLNAKNVKIITMNGHVTLRGPVNNAEEKRQIGDIANRIVQSSNVDNQLETAQNIGSN